MFLDKTEIGIHYFKTMECMNDNKLNICIVSSVFAKKWEQDLS